MDRETVDAYDAMVGAYEAGRPARHQAEAGALATLAVGGLPVADLGCGPGGYLDALGAGPVSAPVGAGAAGLEARPVNTGSRVVGLDASRPMLARAREVAPAAPLVRADLEALPFRRGALGGAWARNAYVHLPRDRTPVALAQLHAALAPGAPVVLTAINGDGDGPWPDDDLPGRFFGLWSPDRFAEVVAGAGFAVDEVRTVGDATWVFGRRDRTLPDFVGPGMRLLVCGLNPSLVAADAGFGYAGRTNRFWPAALASGLVTVSRDPFRSLVEDGIGMTDLVKRATARADALTVDEYRAGAERLRRLVQWLRPRAVVCVGLAGWRAAIDRQARPGLQPGPLAGCPVYVMPSTSGLNARTTLSELSDHMRAAMAVADG